jgi:NRAMP (natural resistance-associated macrophage protein)-like metal ion transporter
MELNAMGQQSLLPKQHQREDEEQIVVEPFSWRKLFKFMGPAFLVSNANMDPGNLDSDIQSGAMLGYELIWVIVLASTMGLVLQILSMKMGIITGKNLAELSKAEYKDTKWLLYTLFAISELTIIAADIPEVVGTAIALNILGNVPLWAGVLVTAVSVVVFIGLGRFGAKAIEIFIALLIAVILFCFLAQVGITGVPFVDILGGFVPKLTSTASIYSLIALVGSVVMPHNFFLHSGLVQNRHPDRSYKELHDACRYNTVESAFAIAISALVNISVIALSAHTMFGNEEAGLKTVPTILSSSLGGNTATILFAIALLASGQSSTMTGTFAGQIVMEGFIDLKMSDVVRAMLTRGLAIIPSLIVSIIYGQNGADDLIVLSQVILSILLPFPLICLIKLTGSSQIMGRRFANSVRVQRISYVLAFFVCLANIVGISLNLADILSSSSTGVQVVVWLLYACILLLYLGLLYILIRRPVHASLLEEIAQKEQQEADSVTEAPAEAPAEEAAAAPTKRSKTKSMFTLGSAAARVPDDLRLSVRYSLL